MRRCDHQLTSPADAYIPFVSDIELFKTVLTQNGLHLDETDVTGSLVDGQAASEDEI